jgi:nucleotide-binding universal stress UspA family protein
MIPKIQTVLYATDLSKNSAYAFRYAVNTAKQHDAKIHLLHAIEPLSPQEEALALVYVEKEEIDRRRRDATENLRERIEERLKQFAEKELQDDPETLKRVVGIHVVQGNPATEILNMSDKLGCDIIIMGTHGKGVISHAFLGSVSEKVLHRIRKPVYIIPLPKEDTDITLGEI